MKTHKCWVIKFKSENNIIEKLCPWDYYFNALKSYKSLVETFGNTRVQLEKHLYEVIDFNPLKLLELTIIKPFRR